MRFLACCLVLILAACCCAEEPAVQFHGHLGPWLVAGVRIGTAGLRTAGADGYFDVDVNVEGPLALPPQACFLDGLQVATGATLGKRNLKWVEAPRLAVRVKNVHTGKTVVVRPTSAMMEWIASAKGSPLSPANPNRAAAAPNKEHETNDSHALDAIARRIAKAPESEILTISRE